MIEELYFNPDEQIKISAASVGISKRKWVFTPSNINDIDSIGKKMQSGRFDVLPIV